VTAELLDNLAATPGPELIADFAALLPVSIIAEILGVPQRMRSRLLVWGHGAASLLDTGMTWPRISRRGGGAAWSRWRACASRRTP
jgi:cytochrome P450